MSPLKINYWRFYMKQYKEKVEVLKNMCENYLFFVQCCVNENAASDRMLEVLLNKAYEIF